MLEIHTDKFNTLVFNTVELPKLLFYLDLTRNT